MRSFPVFGRLGSLNLLFQQALVVNHDTNTVVWAAPGHGKKVLEQFYRQLTPQQLASIRVVTGDGARWITDCVNQFTPGCERCVDPFHVVEWAMEALDEVRREAWRKAHTEAAQAEKSHPKGKGRPKAEDTDAQMVAAAKAKATEIKLIVRKAHGFRNIQNMLDMVYLVCSNLGAPLPNRKSKQPQAA